MKNILLLVLILVSLISFSQNETENLTKTRLLKIYVNFNSYETETIDHYSTYSTIEEGNFITYGKISFALETIKKKKISHEFELMPFFISMNKSLETRYYYGSGNSISSGGEKVICLEAYGRYRINYCFSNYNKGFRPFIGLSTGLFYNQTFFRPQIATTFPSGITCFTVPVEVVSGFDVKLHDRLRLAFDIPINLNNIVFEYEYNDNPTYPEKLRSSKVLYGVFLPKAYNIKLGLCYSIN